jgi:Family of unknown function (DUF6496)
MRPRPGEISEVEQWIDVQKSHVRARMEIAGWVRRPPSNRNIFTHLLSKVLPRGMAAAATQKIPRSETMARYGKKSQDKVKKVMKEKKKGTLRSGKSGKKVKSRKQAIAIGLSEARKSGAKVPAKKRSSKKK